jgi:hypothetical protein
VSRQLLSLTLVPTEQQQNKSENRSDNDSKEINLCLVQDSIGLPARRQLLYEMYFEMHHNT